MSIQNANGVSLLGRTLISTKLLMIVVGFVMVLTAVIGLFVVTHNIGLGVRAYVAGEGAWSKGQKDAVYSLSRYVDSADEQDYRDYLAAIAIPLGDRAARLEMEKPHYELQKVVAGFVQGNIPAEDVPHMVFLFRYLDQVPFFSQAITIWRLAEREVLQLPPVAEAAHTQIQAGQLSAAAKTALLDQIHNINVRVTPLEQQFSQTLSNGAREGQALLLYITLAVAVALVAIGIVFAWGIAREIRASISGLRAGALRVAQGNLTETIPVRSRDELGDLAQVFNSMIEARREAETSLRTANEFRQKVMESATNAIYTMDMEGRFTTANQRTCEITGYPLEELIGRTWASIVHEADLPDLMEGFVSTIEGREPITNREISLPQKNGNEVVITFSAAPLRRDGVIFGAVGVAEDITERKRAEVQLKARAEELVRSNRELEQFAYVASHDLQEPLRTVTGFAQLLMRRYQGQLGGDAEDFINYINDGVQRMKSLIEDLLSYSRVQRADAVLKEVSMDTVLANALANLGSAIHAAGAMVTREPLPTVAVDERQFVQLFQNLIGNALKFRGTEPPKVHIEAVRENQLWHFTVADNGIGIDAEAAERVFMLFQRLHTRDHYEGNGIGLTICKKIVELHGGRIWVEPTPAGGTGTVFHFTLPVIGA